MIKLLSVADVAELFGVSEAWVRDHAAGRREPKLPAVKLGTDEGRGIWKFMPQDIEDFLNDQKSE